MAGDGAWARFLDTLGSKTKSTPDAPKTVRAALDNAPVRPEILLSFGIHGNILYPDAGYCEFDDPALAWERIQAWAACPLPVGFEVGIASLEELAKTRPVWDCLARHGVSFTNPLFAQPYLRIIGEASTLLQFRSGLDALRSRGLDVPAFCSSEHALHPQLPQLLAGFGIPAAVAVARLAGGAPTSYSPRVDWQGLDGTVIPAVVAQAGLPSGQTWHGKFFEELPSLVFAAVSRPDLDHVAFTNIEDFANPSPLAREIAGHLDELAKNGIRFVRFDELVSRLEPGRQVRWGIEDFPIKHLPASRAITAITRCEHELVNLEGIATMLAVHGAPVDPASLDGAWRDLLLAQNHDALVVPFTTPGLYSKMQSIEARDAWETRVTVEEYSLRLVDRARVAADHVLGEGDGIANWLWARDAIVNGAPVHLPPCSISPAGKLDRAASELLVLGPAAIRVDGPRARLDARGLEPGDGGSGTILDNDAMKVQLFPGPARAHVVVEVTPGSGASLVLEHVHDIAITYPFGAEPTTERRGHALHAWWIDREFVLVHEGTPYFTFDPVAAELSVHVPPGAHRFALGMASTLTGVFRHAWEVHHPPLPCPLPDAAQRDVHRFDHAGCVPVLLATRGGEIDATFLSIDGSVPCIDGAQPVDLRGNDVVATNAGTPWRIHRFLLGA